MYELVLFLFCTVGASMEKETNEIGDGLRPQTRRLWREMEQVREQERTKNNIEAGPKAQTDTEVEAEREAGVKIEVKVLVAAKAEAEADIIITKEKQNEIIHRHTRSAQKGPKPVVQVSREKRDDEDGLEVKILPQKLQKHQLVRLNKKQM